MKYKVFDVVELSNKNKATILDVMDKNMYKAEIVNSEGTSLGIMKISEDDIIKVIHKK